MALRRSSIPFATPAAEQGGVEDSKMLRLALFTFGFLLQTNVHLPEFTHFRHITDPIALILAGASLVFCLPRLKSQTALLHYGLLGLILLAALLFQAEQQKNEMYNKIILISYCVFAIWLTHVFLKRKSFYAFCWGILSGYLVSVAILIADATTSLPLHSFGLAPDFEPELERFNLRNGEVGALTLRLDKAGGIWSHGNEAGPTLALAGAAAAWLSKRYKSPAIFQVFLLLYLASFAYTLNRSGLIAVGIVWLTLVSRRIDGSMLLRGLVTISLAACILLALYLAGVLDPMLDAITRKLIDDQNATSNSAERFASSIAGLETLVRYPFGIGTTARYATIFSLAGVRTPHNGFIAVGFDLGLIGALMLAGSTIYVLIRDRKNLYMFATTVIFSVCMFFEELLLNPVFMMTAGFIVARAVWMWCGESGVGSTGQGRWLQTSRRRRNPLLAGEVPAALPHGQGRSGSGAT